MRGEKEIICCCLSNLHEEEEESHCCRFFKDAKQISIDSAGCGVGLQFKVADPARGMDQDTTSSKATCYFLASKVKTGFVTLRPEPVLGCCTFGRDQHRNRQVA